MLIVLTKILHSKNSGNSALTTKEVHHLLIVPLDFELFENPHHQGEILKGGLNKF